MIDVNAIVAEAREAERLSQAIRKTEDGREFLIGPEGEINWLTDKEEAPQFVKAAPVFSEAVSLAAYVARFAETSTPLMAASISLLEVRVTLDYPTKDGPTRGQHSASWKLSESPEFKTWSAVAGKSMSQEAFMRFLEENTLEIVSPDAARRSKP